MTVEELKDKHYEDSVQELNDGSTYELSHTNISIQFAIDCLEEFHLNQSTIYTIDIYNKIEQLKKELV